MTPPRNPPDRPEADTAGGRPRRGGAGRPLAASLLLLGLAGAGAAYFGAGLGRDRPGAVILPVPPLVGAGPAARLDVRAALAGLAERDQQLERRLEALGQVVDELRATVAALAERASAAPAPQASPAPDDPPRYVGSIADGNGATVADASGSAPPPQALSDEEPEDLPALGAGHRPAGPEPDAGTGARAVRAGSAAYRAGDWVAAERAWRPAAEAGDARAQYLLAALYYEGRLGGAPDLVAAYAWASCAAAQGDERAPELVAALEGELPPDRLATAHRQPVECVPG